MQTNQLDFSRSLIPNILDNLRREIEYLDRSGAFIPEYAIDPAKRTPEWSTLLINIGNQLRPLKNPGIADTNVYDVIVNGFVPEGLEVLFKNDVLIMRDAYINLYNLLANFSNIYGQMLQNVVLQAQGIQTSYGRKYKKGKCKGKCKCKM